MSALTKKEREGLEEVYISLKKQNSLYQKSKDFIRLSFYSIFSTSSQKTSKTPEFGNFMDKFDKKYLIFIKLKKFLSK